MSDSSYSEQIQGLSDDYYNSRIELDEYRLRRKVLLDELDREINGVIIDEPMMMAKIACLAGSSILSRIPKPKKIPNRFGLG